MVQYSVKNKAYIGGYLGCLPAGTDKPVSSPALQGQGGLTQHLHQEREGLVGSQAGRQAGKQASRKQVMQTGRQAGREADRTAGSKLGRQPDLCEVGNRDEDDHGPGYMEVTY